MKKTVLLLTAACALAGCGDKKSEASATTDAPAAAVTAPSPPSPPPPPPAQKKWDGPLGVTAGLTATELTAAGIKLEPGKTPGIFFSDDAPSPNQSFLLYSYLIGEDSGLCRISAITKPIEANAAGDQIKSSFSNLEEALESKYGKPKKYQFVKHNALFKEDRHWMMALKDEERIHTSYWGSEKVKLPDPLNTISLQASANSAYEGHIKLTYEFLNIDKCLEESKKKANASL